MKWIEDLPADFTQAFHFSVTGVDDPHHWLNTNLSFGERNWDDVVTLTRDEILDSITVRESILHEDLGKEVISWSYWKGYTTGGVIKTYGCCAVNESIRRVAFRDNRMQSVPDLSGFPSLISLDLSYCEAIFDVSRISELRCLRSLNLRGCKHLESVSGLNGLTSLASLNLGWCEALQDASGLSELTSLTKLDLSWCKALKELSVLSELVRLDSLSLSHSTSLQDTSVLSNLIELTGLNLSCCESLENLTGLSGLTSLKTLDLSHCKSLENVFMLSGLSELTSLDLSHCTAITDVQGLSQLSRMTSLNLGNCNSLGDLSGISQLTSLTKLNLRDCKALEDVSVLSELAELTDLDLSNCESLRDISGLSNLINLRYLNLTWCVVLKDLSGLSMLTNLISLDLGKCFKLHDVAELSSLHNLTMLNLSMCWELRDISGLSGLANLKNLNLSMCKELEDASVLSTLKGLTSLDMSDCTAFKDLSVVGSLTTLTSLSLRACEARNVSSWLSQLVSLTKLDLSSCRDLQDTSEFLSLEGLTHLDLSQCSSLQDVSGLAGLTNLISLNLSSCDGLVDISGLSSLTNLVSLNLSSCNGLEDISVLSSLSSLEFIDLSHCVKQQDISWLSTLTKIQSLSLRGCRYVDHELNRNAISKLDCLTDLEGIAEPWHTTILWNAATKRGDLEYLDQHFYSVLELCENANLNVLELKKGLLRALPLMNLSESQLKSLDSEFWTPQEWSMIWGILREDNPSLALSLLKMHFDVENEITKIIQNDSRPDFLHSMKSMVKSMVSVRLHGYLIYMADGAAWFESIELLASGVKWLRPSALNAYGPDLLMALRVSGLADQEKAVLARLTQSESKQWLDEIELKLARVAVEQGDVKSAIYSIGNLPIEMADEVRLELIHRWGNEMPDEVAGWMSGFHNATAREHAAFGLVSSDSNVATSSARHLVLMDLVPNREALLNFIQAMAAGVPDDPWVKALQAEVAQTEAALSQEVLESIGLELLRQDEAVREEVGDRKLRKLIEASGEKAAVFREQARQAGLNLLRRQDLID